MAAANKNTNNDDDLLQQFMSITGSDENTALHFLEACDGDLSAAIGMHMDSSGAASAPAPAPVPGPSKSSTSASSSRGSGKRKRSHSPVGSKQPAPLPPDDVRPPIPQKHEVLVQDNVVYGRQGRRRKTQSIFDQFRDFQEEARQHELAQNGNSASVSKRRTLEDLFRPPIDLLHKGSFKSACESSAGANKWLIVNVQNVQEFACQVLNRDVWSNLTVKELIRRRFVLWQTYSDSEEGRRHINLYKVSEWPYIAVIDPRTGEKMISWNRLEANSFCEIAAEFLDQHPAPEESDAESTPTKKPPNENSIVDASEDSQITAAIAASLKENSVCKKKETFFAASATTSDEEDGACFYSSDSDLETFSDSDSSRPEPSASSSFKSKGDRSPEPPEVVSSRLRTTSVDETILDGIPGAVDDDDDGEEVKTCVNGEQNGRGAPEGKSRESDNELWKTYLGPDSDPKSNIMLRFPDGVRLPLSIPCSSKLRSLVCYVADLGYPHDKYELVTTFPKRKLSQLDLDTTLRESGLNSQETVFIQEL